jgi:hypothetical protein
MLCIDRPPEFEPDDRAARRLEYGSLLNLPRASASIDAVLLIAGELDPDIAPFVLREIFRILKPGGQLDLAIAGESKGLDLGRSLAAARIAFDEGETPSAPVYSCSLTKNVGQAEVASPCSRLGASVGSPEGAPGEGAVVNPELSLLEAENTRQILLVRDIFDERQELVDEALAVVDRAVQRGFGADGWIWVSNLFAEGYPTKFFLSGWDAAQDWVIWSREEKCRLMLPLSVEQPAPGQRLELQLHLACPETSASNPITIGVRVDDGPIDNFRISTDDGILKILAPADSSRFRGLSLVEFHVSAETHNGAAEQLRVGRAMGVRRFRYRLVSSEGTSPPP